MSTTNKHRHVEKRISQARQLRAEGKELIEIAEILGVSRSYACKLASVNAERLLIQRQPSTEHNAKAKQQRDQQIRQMRLAKIPTKDIAARLGISVKLTLDILRRQFPDKYKEKQPKERNIPADYPPISTKEDIIRACALGYNQSQISLKTGISVNSVNQYYRKWRRGFYPDIQLGGFERYNKNGKSSS